MNKKFKTIFAILMMGVLMYAPSAMALSCTKSAKGDLLITGSKEVTIGGQIPDTVALIVTIIKVAIPVILVILGMIDLFKGVTAQKDDEIKKAQQLFVKRLVAAVLVFFVVTIVQLVISFADDKDKDQIWTCANCFLRGMDSCGK